MHHVYMHALDLYDNEERYIWISCVRQCYVDGAVHMKFLSSLASVYQKS